MPFIKGQSGNPAGRKQGVKSSESEQALRDFLQSKTEQYFFGTGDNTFSSDMEGLSSSKRLELYEKYLKYFLASMGLLVGICNPVLRTLDLQSHLPNTQIPNIKEASAVFIISFLGTPAQLAKYKY